MTGTVLSQGLVVQLSSPISCNVRRERLQCSKSSVQRTLCKSWRERVASRGWVDVSGGLGSLDHRKTAVRAEARHRWLGFSAKGATSFRPFELSRIITLPNDTIVLPKSTWLHNDYCAQLSSCQASALARWPSELPPSPRSAPARQTPTTHRAGRQLAANGSLHRQHQERTW